MPIDTSDLKTRVKELSIHADRILAIEQTELSRTRREYETWYSQARLLVQAYLPERLDEFKDLYLASRPFYADYWGISTYLSEGTSRSLFEAGLERQIGILQAIPAVIEVRALEVAALVTADLVEGELDEARFLLDHGFIRAAGAVAGVALEAHLKLLHDQRGLLYTDKDSIVSLASNLRQHGTITLGDEKQCIAMADTRNKRDHKKKSEPTLEEVEELIDDVSRFTKRVQVV